MLTTPILAVAGQISTAMRSNPGELRSVAEVSVWGRWGIAAFGIFIVAYRPDFATAQYIAYVTILSTLVVGNALLHRRFRSDAEVTWPWLAGTSALDILLLSSIVIMSEGFESITFVAYYPALALFGVAFPSFRLSLLWTLMVATIYVLACVFVGEGISLEAAEERELFMRVFFMFPAVLGGSWVAGIERRARREALARERALLQERIELTQTIHDTTAQTAYMIGLGIDHAMDIADDSDEQLHETLAATAALSRSAMWDLRRPIDMGDIFEGRALGAVLHSHVDTFTTISTVAAEFAQSGSEPPLPVQTRARLFSIANNALTNAYRHANARQVEVKLDFEREQIRLSIRDDGDGLPRNFQETGHGIRSMQADAKLIGGTLTVGAPPGSVGTLVTCEVPDASPGA